MAFPRKDQTPQMLARAVCALAMAAALAVPASAEDDRDHEIATAMVYNFARFTTWPDDVVQDAAPFTICAQESSAIFAALADLRGRTIKDRPVAVIDSRTARSAGAPCQIELIDRAPSTPAPLERGTLYVALQENDAPDAASLILVRVGRQTRFIANPSAAKSSGLVLSSKLLNLAVKIR